MREETPLKPDELQGLFDEAIGKLLTDENISDQDCEKLIAAMPDIIKETINTMSDLTYESLLQSMPSMLLERREEVRVFEERHYELWKKGIDLLEAYLIIAAEIGESFNENYRAEAAQTQDYLFEALIGLQARVVQVGREVLALLSSGFADGARWCPIRS